MKLAELVAPLTPRAAGAGRVARSPKVKPVPPETQEARALSKAPEMSPSMLTSARPRRAPDMTVKGMPVWYWLMEAKVQPPRTRLFL